MRILFVCSTEFQILNALNIKMHLLPQDKADIVLQRSGFQALANRLKKIGMFENICVAKDWVVDVHEYIRIVRAGGHTKTSFLQAIGNTFFVLYRDLMGKLRGPEYRLGKLLHDYEKIRGVHYDKVLMQSGNAIVSNFYESLHGVAKMAILDEGVGSYYDNTICHGDTKANEAYLYDPEVVVYDKDGIDFVKIPRLSSAGEEFLSIANRIFDFDPQHQVIKGKKVFFDIGGELMPSYMQNAKGLKRMILANSIKKHMEDHNIYMSQIAAFKKIAGTEKVFIKYHPRTPDSMLKEYDESVFQSIEPRKIPWELYACNNDIEDCVFISIASSSVCLSPLTIGDGNKCVLIRKCLDMKISPQMEKLLDNLHQKYSNCFFLPDSLDSLL
ncbi:MAG: hypothetical protein K6C05_06620 [Anaerovibrio sp.]|uniref:hypothetical protein n=1 Tax=Anaerovibrio sp. TaxID=1872532 RepID=UPI0025DC0DD6|nr:hypothetical protein [Anaerovibrio sp.]MCR5176512.1 hypothetical protein [Anaerovibrio sp.]